jgi:predicted transcriptional regulator
VILAIRSGAISRADAYDRYMMSEEELRSWETAFDDDGIAGLLLKRSPSVLGRIGAPAKEVMPAVSIKYSVGSDAIICLECGHRAKMLKRHLAKHRLTPDAYRERWGLARDYPMVAPGYVARRSELAKSFSLGHWRRRRVGHRTA